MAKYIGNIPSVGEFKKLDSLTSTFNGSLTQFDLEYGSTSVSVGDASQLIVSLNGIIQEPLTAYTLAVGGSAIVFSSAPASTDTCHIILLGGVGGTSTVSDGAVTAAKLDAGLKDYLEETYTANGSQTTYALTRAPIGTNDLMITIDGIVQPSTAYSIAGTTLTISPALPNGTDVRVVHMGVRAGFVVPSSSSITAAMFQDFTTDVKFNDNAKAVFGTGNDLQIYHSGTHSWITNSTGYLHINAANIELKNAADNETMLLATQNGAVKLSYDNSVKLATTATGIDVTGTVISDGLTVQSNNYLDIHDADNHVSGRLRNVSGSNNALAIEADPDNSASGSFINFKIDASEKMRIDSSGNLLVGKTSSSTTTAGNELRAGGLAAFTKSGSYSLNLNRLSSDGDIAVFQKDGTTVGSIGSRAGVASYIVLDPRDSGGNGGVGLTGVGAVIRPTNYTGGQTDNHVSLGSSTARFKDAYLSDGIYLGGTGADNKLDDYEEGSFNFGVVTGSLGVNSKGKYTKIGNSVTIYAQVDAATDFTTSAAIYLTGLPFVAQSPHTTGHAGQGAVSYADGMGNNVISVVARSGYSQAFFSNLDTGTTTHSDCTRSWNVRFTLSYFTNS
ncbi:hypothetical protein OAE42_05535 [Gammaproteobacteria bacterium]|nr:hypothetical protein [Gammaproteobacteria bacterium]